MRTVPPALLAHVQGESTSLAICWMIEKKNGDVIRGTEHDVSITIDPTGMSPESDLVGIYPAGANIRSSTIQSASDMAVDNMNVDGALPAAGVQYVDITVADIEAGLLNQAPVTVFYCNWEAPNDGQLILRRGYLGDISRDSDGQYKTEVRGLAQLLAQQFVQSYGVRCQVKKFGDAQCKLDITPFTFAGTVTSVTNRKAFATDLSLSPFPDFRGAEFVFTSGDNAGYTREAKSGDFTFWEAWPNDVQPGDAFTVTQACDRTIAACKQYDNVVNFRGYGVFIPGIDALAKGPV